MWQAIAIFAFIALSLTLLRREWETPSVKPRPDRTRFIRTRDDRFAIHCVEGGRMTYHFTDSQYRVALLLVRSWRDEGLITHQQYDELRMAILENVLGGVEVRP